MSEDSDYRALKQIKRGRALGAVKARPTLGDVSRGECSRTVGRPGFKKGDRGVKPER